MPRWLIRALPLLCSFNVLALEVAWTRMLAQVHENPVHSFADNRLLLDPAHNGMIKADLLLPCRSGVGSRNSLVRFRAVCERLKPGGACAEQWNAAAGEHERYGLEVMCDWAGRRVVATLPPPGSFVLQLCVAGRVYSPQPPPLNKLRRA